MKAMGTTMCWWHVMGFVRYFRDGVAKPVGRTCGRTLYQCFRFDKDGRPEPMFAHGLDGAAIMLGGKE